MILSVARLVVDDTEMLSFFFYYPWPWRQVKSNSHNFPTEMPALSPLRLFIIDIFDVGRKDFVECDVNIYRYAMNKQFDLGDV